MTCRKPYAALKRSDISPEAIEVTSGISLTAPWLIIAYILVALGALTGALLNDPVFREINTAAQPTSGDVPPEVNKGLNSTRVRAFQ